MARKTLRVSINPDVLKWARESAGLTLQEAAKRVGANAGTFGEWESGSREPTLKTLETLATFYRRPLAAFFLPTPPKESPLPTDFRVLPDERRRRLSKAARLAIREARRLQARAAELMRELGIERVAQVGTTSLTEDPEEVAATEREGLGVTIEEQTCWRSPYEAFRRWRQAVEALGILVFQMRMPVEEVRGFSLLEDNPPVITVSASDAIRARIFSLFHEYAHLLLETGGICIPDERLGGHATTTREETFCNHFAGALLVPAVELKRRRDFSVGPLEDLERLANCFQVSREVVCRRMRLIGDITERTYQAKIKEWGEASGRQRRRGSFGIAAPKRCLDEKGHKFANLVLEARARDLITYSEVVDCLGIRMKYLDQVQAVLSGQE